MPLAKMLPFKEDTPDWLKPYVIYEEENFPELANYLINPENEFSGSGMEKSKFNWIYQ